MQVILMNDKIIKKINDLKKDNKTILKYIELFKNNEKAKEIFKEDLIFQKLNETKKDIDE